MATAVERHWNQATRVVKRRELIEFIRQFDKNTAEKVYELSKYQDLDAAVYRLLIYIGENSNRIVYCGKEYKDLQDYVTQLSSGKDEIAKRFLTSGLLVLYLRNNDADKSIVDKLESLINRTGCADMVSITTVCLALQGEKSVNVFGVSVDSLDALIPVLSKHSIKEIDDLLNNERFIAWINRLGYEKEMRKMRESYRTNE